MKWFEKAFNKEYLAVYKHRSDQQALDEINLIHSLFPLNQNHLLLDLCCGGGRHSLMMADSGAKVIGYDLSKDLLLEADRMRHSKVLSNLLFVRGNMLELPYKDNFHIATSFFNSFGYFSDDEDNLKVLKNVFKSLKAQGVFFIDVMNKHKIIKELKKSTVKVENGLSIHEDRWILNKRVEKKVKIYGIENSSKLLNEYTESVRLYEERELAELLKLVGFSIEGVYGESNGESYTEDSSRMIFFAKRK